MKSITKNQHTNVPDDEKKKAIKKLKRSNLVSKIEQNIRLCGGKV
jgi:hypothetical protein